MPSDFNQFGQRYERRAKRRKTNIILNSLIAIVMILIFIVAYNIFIAGDTNKEKATATVSTEKIEKNNKSEPENTKEPTVKDKQSDVQKVEEDIDTDETSSGLIEGESDEPNVEKVIINPNWQPIGTQQTAGHEPSSEKGSADWNEKVAALSYAVSIPVDQMTVWWLGRGDDPDNQAIGTVSAKGAGSDAYRVHIEWIDGEGWKPTVVKKLIKNDKK